VAWGGKAAARHISPDGYHHDGDGDLLPSNVDAPHPLLADRPCPLLVLPLSSLRFLHKVAEIHGKYA
jgi:hypothetical protein